VKSPNAAQAAVDMLLNIEKAAIITSKATLKVGREPRSQGISFIYFFLLLLLSHFHPSSLSLPFLPLNIHVSINPNLLSPDISRHSSFQHPFLPFS
jgi:hypothetical protein